MRGIASRAKTDSLSCGRRRISLRNQRYNYPLNRLCFKKLSEDRSDLLDGRGFYRGLRSKRSINFGRIENLSVDYEGQNRSVVIEGWD